MKRPTNITAVSLAAIFLLSGIHQPSAYAATDSPNSKGRHLHWRKHHKNAADIAASETKSAIPLNELPPCSNPEVCGAGKEKRPILTLKGIWVDAAEWKFSQDTQSPFNGSTERSVFLDPGHGGSDSGAQRAGVLEKELTLQLAFLYRKALEQRGAMVILARAIDLFIGLDERVDAIKRHRPDVAVSIHINSSQGDTTASGIETYFTTDESKPLAEFIHKAILKSTGAKDRGIHKNNFYIPKNSPVPTILVEHGFVNNAEERKLLQSPEYQAKLATGMEQGTEDYFNWLDKSKDEKTPTQPQPTTPSQPPVPGSPPSTPSPTSPSTPSGSPTAPAKTGV